MIANEILAIKYGSLSEPFFLQLFNLYGQPLKRMKLNSQQDVYIKDLEEGVYFLKISGGAVQPVIERLIIIH
ncbi:MAG: T9SS type A sorting domain-containing protein [Chitinophagales bacterium]|nr:T9SS type A sorting domain-containing protein [Chitinophagales bacterium]